MRWLKFILPSLALILGVYALSVYALVKETRSFKIEKTVDYPVDKVFPQFNNLQNFARWNYYFSGRKMVSEFYEPYEGQGSSMSFHEQKKNYGGEFFIRYENKNSTLKYQLYEDGQSNPYLINLKFTPLAGNKTKITWFVHTPRQPLLKRPVNLWSESDFIADLDKSMVNLSSQLSNKVDKDKQLAAIKYDTLMIENQEGNLLLGVNVSTANKKDQLLKNIVLNHHKVFNFITNDMQKREDEFGLPVLITDPGNYKDKEVSYFCGFPLSKRIGVSDNNFIFRSLNPSKMYVMYYQGNYAGRIRAIQQLLTRAKKDTMRNGELQEVFIAPPTENGTVTVKLALPVFK